MHKDINWDANRTSIVSDKNIINFTYRLLCFMWKCSPMICKSTITKFVGVCSITVLSKYISITLSTALSGLRFVLYPSLQTCVKKNLFEKPRS